MEMCIAIADFEAAEDCNVSLRAGQCVQVRGEGLVGGASGGLYRVPQGRPVCAGEGGGASGGL